MLIITIDILIHTDVHQIPVVGQSDRTVVENTDQMTIVINRTATSLTFTLRNHRVGSVLHNKFVKAFQHALSMFTGEHPAIFRCTRLQVVIVRNIGVTVVNAQFQRTAWVDFHTG
ncbi:hypothetical protein D3C72_1435730 [compost metagenome]